MTIKDGPLWQLEENLKHYRSLVQTYRNESQDKLRKAAEAESMATEYEAAILKLKGN